jgi:hypothetical protein
MIPIRTSMAFAPAERRLQEDWALFSERDADAPIRRTVLNFAALGDRRDGDGTLWLRFPRMGRGKAYPMAPGTRDYIIQQPAISSVMQVPFTITPPPGRANIPYRVNADRVQIAGTDRPWIYASGLEGFTQGVLALNPVRPLAIAPRQTGITVDGALGNGEWGGDATAAPAATPGARGSKPRLPEPHNTGRRDVWMADTRTSVFLRSDDKFLYAAFHRPPVTSRRGESEPWQATQTGADVDLHADDCYELFISDTESGRAVYLGVTAGGGRFDASASADTAADSTWRGDWQSAVTADATGFTAELAVPWTTLATAGISRATLALNLQADRKSLAGEKPEYPGGKDRLHEPDHGLRQALLSLGADGCTHVKHFVRAGLGAAPAAVTRTFALRLHFAEIRGAQPGERVFDIRVNSETVATDVDVAAAVGSHTAWVRTFSGISAADSLTIELVPKTPDRKPVLCGIEVYEEALLAELSRHPGLR